MPLRTAAPSDMGEPTDQPANPHRGCNRTGAFGIVLQNVAPCVHGRIQTSSAALLGGSRGQDIMSIKALSTLALVAGMSLTIFAPQTSLAAPGSADSAPTKVADAAQVQPAALGEGEEDQTNCNKSRKRLWLEGEGWIVRKVTICR